MEGSGTKYFKNCGTYYTDYKPGETINDNRRSKALLPAEGSSKNPHVGNRFTLEDWRIKFNKNEKTVDGTTWYWCKHHLIYGVYDGLYVKRPENKHDE